MGTNKNVVVSFSIAILLLLSLLLLLTYNSKCNQSHNNGSMMQSSQNQYNLGNYSKTPEPFYFEKFTPAPPAAPPAAPPVTLPTSDRFKISEGMVVTENMADLASVQTSNEVSPQWSARANQQTQNTSPESSMMSSQGQGQGPMGSANGDSSFQSVSNMGGGTGGYSSFDANEQAAQSCFPRDRLTADDLLPKDAADSKWARINPSGSGNIGDQNYLTAGYHVGVNTVGQSLRNANLQLRSEIPNPQNAVGPWMISTIEPDLRQNVLEIGSSISY
jgi:hypothetical protein